MKQHARIFLNGEEWTELDINKRCAELMGIEINKKIFSHLKVCWTVAPVGYLSVKYMPTLDGNHALQIIDKCWDQLIYADYRRDVNWEIIMEQHNCTKLVAACICLIEINEGKL